MLQHNDSLSLILWYIYTVFKKCHQFYLLNNTSANFIKDMRSNILRKCATNVLNFVHQPYCMVSLQCSDTSL